jgi:hypothetical protein
MQFSCTQYSQETPAPSLAVLAPGQHRALALRIGLALQYTRLERADRPKGTMAVLDQACDNALPAAAKPCTPAYAACFTHIQTQRKSWSIMLDFAGITPSAILVKKWRGNRCSRLRPDLPENLCQHRYIWKLNDYHPRQRKRAL